MVAQKHHGFLSHLMGNFHHLLHQLCNFPALEGHKIFIFLRGDSVLVIIIPLVNDILRPEGIAYLSLKLLQNIRRDRRRVTIPVHIFLPFQFIKDQRELMEKRRISDYIYIGMFFNKFPQPLHRELSGLRLAHVKRNLPLKIFPVICNRIVHMYRIPD